MKVNGEVDASVAYAEQTAFFPEENKLSAWSGLIFDINLHHCRDYYKKSCSL